MVKKVQLVFDDSDHAQLVAMKRKHGYTWEEFVLKLLEWEQYAPKWSNTS